LKCNKVLAGLRALAGSSITALCAVLCTSVSAHGAAPAANDVIVSARRSVVEIKLPSLPLVRQDRVVSNLGKELSAGEPVILGFIYTSCSTICPVTSQILSNSQDLLLKDFDKLRIVSVSIDPEYDTPARLTAYSKKFNAKPVWQHYTGTVAQSEAVQKAFGAFQGDKMNHLPLIFIGGGNSKSWVRLEGFPSAEQIAKEYRNASKK
jgi:protein SCO1/2